METLPATVEAETQLKRVFAAALLKHPYTLEGRFQAALSCTGDTGQALLMANKWVSDPEVIAEQKRILETSKDGSLDYLQTEAEFVQELMQEAKACFDSDSRFKYHGLIAEVRGFKRNKVDTQVNLQVNNNRVMIVKNMGTDDDWEAIAERQQRKLLDVSASKH